MGNHYGESNRMFGRFTGHDGLKVALIGRVGTVKTEDLACGLAFKEETLVDGISHCDSVFGTYCDAAAAEPALIGVDDDGCLTLFGVGHDRLSAAASCTAVAAYAFFFVN